MLLCAKLLLLKHRQSGISLCVDSVNRRFTPVRMVLMMVKACLLFIVLVAMETSPMSLLGIFLWFFHSSLIVHAFIRYLIVLFDCRFKVVLCVTDFTGETARFILFDNIAVPFFGKTALVLAEEVGEVRILGH